MKSSDFWKNIKLGEEVSVSGAFIYNGIRRFYELRKLDHPDELFEVFYYLSIGFERLLKIAVVLLEHEDHGEQAALEKSLKTHNHLDLLHRIRRRVALNLATPHNDFLSFLSAFYKTIRYDRFSPASVSISDKERIALCRFLSKHLQCEFPEANSLLGTLNDVRYKKFVRKVVLKISSEVFAVVRERALQLGLHTYELRHGSKAEAVFLGQVDIPAEEVLWKELLIFFMNTKQNSGYLRFLRSITPLDFDPGEVAGYLDCFQSDAAKAVVIDELEHHYTELEGEKSARLRQINAIGAPGASFDDDEDEKGEGGGI